MSVVRGKNVVFRLVGLGLFSEAVIACGRSCTLSTSTSLIETTTAGSGKGATFKPQKNTTTGSIEGVTFLNEAGKATLPWLRQIQLANLDLQASYERTADDGSTYFDIINFYITNITDTGSIGDFNTFQIDIQVNGNPQIITSAGSGDFGYEIQWDYFTDLPPDLSAVTYAHSLTHVVNTEIVIPITDIPANTFFVMRINIAETNPTTWYNTALNNGTVPDFVFGNITTIGLWKYIKTRNATSFDGTQPLKFTH